MPSACLRISYASRRLPQMSTLSTVPPSLRTTLRNVSKDGATVRSSSVGSRMTMISYGRMKPHHLLWSGRPRSFRGRRVACVGNRIRLQQSSLSCEIAPCRGQPVVGVKQFGNGELGATRILCIVVPAPHHDRLGGAGVGTEFGDLRLGHRAALTLQ